MAKDELALSNLRMLINLCREKNLQDYKIDLVEEFLSRREVGLPDQIEGADKASLCDTCAHSACCVMFLLTPSELSVKVAACRLHVPVPSETEEAPA